MIDDKTESNEEIYKDTETDGITKNVGGEQTIQTSETKILKGTDTEVLIGKDIEKVQKLEEDHESLQRKILNKMMK
jgi:hypothetical protein